LSAGQHPAANRRWRHSGFELRHAVAGGHVAPTERVDHFRLPRKVISLPMDTFEVLDRQIATCRGYFDVNQFITQLNARPPVPVSRRSSSGPTRGSPRATTEVGRGLIVR
jgi:hypothetical protein